jgi:hypothetical protein
MLAPSVRMHRASLSDIPSNPVSSVRLRILRMSGHFESNAVSDVMSFSSRLSGHFLCHPFFWQR